MLSRFRMLVACALTLALCWVPGFAFAGDAEDGAQVAVTAKGLSYGLDGFERLAKGTARVMEGQPEGYRFPVEGDTDLIVAPAADRVVVWISPKAVETYGWDLQNNESVSGLKTLVCELDGANCMGGARLEDMDLPWYATTEAAFNVGGYTYAFDERGANGDRYVVIASASGDAKGGAILLGLRGVVLIGHGATSVEAVKNGTLAAAEAVRAGLVENVANSMDGIVL